MTKLLSIEQHQMLEDLSNRQYTRRGKLRKTVRSLKQPNKLGLLDRENATEQSIIRLLDGIKLRFKNKNSNS